MPRDTPPLVVNAGVTAITTPTIAPMDWAFLLGFQSGVGWFGCPGDPTNGLKVQLPVGASATQVTDIPNATTTGLSSFVNTAASNTVLSIKTTAGKLYGLHVDNTANASKTYIQVFNLLAANVTLGTTVPFYAFVILTSGVYDFAWGEPGITFGTAISFALTTTATGLTAQGSACVVNAQFI
jgi:hypothetical protein